MSQTPPATAWILGTGVLLGALVASAEQASSTPSRRKQVALAEQLHARAVGLARRGKYDQAEAMLGRALAVLERDLRPEDPRLANTLEELAQVKRRQGKYVEAITHYATVFGDDPHGSITTGLRFWRGPYGVEKEFATVVWDVVWEVVTTYPHTGVERDRLRGDRR